MKARVKEDCRWPIIQACTGREFVQYEWRPVPAGQERDASTNPYLNVQEASMDESAAEDTAVLPASLTAAAEANLPEFRAFVTTLGDLDDLARLHRLEAEGKARDGAFDAIEDRMAELNGEA